MGIPTLYRLFNVNGVLLYVGATNNPTRRFAEHKMSKEWWPEVASITLEQASSRQDLKCREDAAIRDEYPRYNHLGMGTRLPLSPCPNARRDLETVGLELKFAREELAEVMREARDAALEALEDGFTEVEVARALGVERMTVRKWRGK